MISAGTVDHLLTDLSLEFLCLTADLIKLVENGLQFFRRQTRHAEPNANCDNSADCVKPPELFLQLPPSPSTLPQFSDF